MLDSFALGSLVALNVKDKGHNDCVMWSEVLIGAVGVLLMTVYNSYLNNCSFYESYQLYHSATGYMQNPLTGNTYFFVALFFAGVLRYCINTAKKHPVLSSTPLVALGGMTYELYCFHFPIRTLSQHFISNELIMSIVALIITFAASFVWKRWLIHIINKVVS